MKSLYKEGPASRVDLARALDLTKPTLTSLSSELISRGLIREIGVQKRPQVGRPVTVLSLNADSVVFIGASIDIDRIAVAGMDLEGRRLDVLVDKANFVKLSPTETLTRLVDNVRKFRKTKIDKVSRIGGIGVSIPAFMGPSGEVLNAPPLGWREVPVQAILAKALKSPVRVENDANLLAHAEWYLSDEHRGQELMAVLISSGVGAGMITAQGNLIRGAHGRACEVGHLTIYRMAAGKTAGRHFRWEQLVGGLAVAEQCEKAFGKGADFAELKRRVEAEDSKALKIVETWIDWLACGLSNLVFSFDPNSIVIGGELTFLIEKFRERIVERMSAFLVPGIDVPGLDVSQLGVIGAAMGGASIMHADFMEIPENFSRMPHTI